MKILIINPNSSSEMSVLIENAARVFADGSFGVDCLTTPGAHEYIENYEHKVTTGPGMIQLLKDNLDQYDAFINACHCDPHNEALKEITHKPVVGIGEASMKIATMLGHRFSVISDTLHSVPMKEAIVHQYHLSAQLASVRASSNGPIDHNDRKKYLEIARKTIEEDGAEVIVLGCAGLVGMDKYLQEQLNVPVLDGVICALIIARGLAKYGVGSSKQLRYKAL